MKRSDFLADSPISQSIFNNMGTITCRWAAHARKRKDDINDDDNDEQDDGDDEEDDNDDDQDDNDDEQDDIDDDNNGDVVPLGHLYITLRMPQTATDSTAPPTQFIITIIIIIYVIITTIIIIIITITIIQSYYSSTTLKKNCIIIKKKNSSFPSNSLTKSKEGLAILTHSPSSILTRLDTTW